MAEPSDTSPSLADKLGDTPMISRIFDWEVLSTVSNAALRSMKAINRRQSLSYSQDFSMIRRKVEIWSIVDLLRLKPASCGQRWL